jgi:hypothetical protein
MDGDSNLKSQIATLEMSLSHPDGLFGKAAFFGTDLRRRRTLTMYQAGFGDAARIAAPSRISGA